MMVTSAEAIFRFAIAFLTAVPSPIIWLKFAMASIPHQAPLISFIGSPSFFL